MSGIEPYFVIFTTSEAWEGGSGRRLGKARLLLTSAGTGSAPSSGQWKHGEAAREGKALAYLGRNRERSLFRPVEARGGGPGTLPGRVVHCHTCDCASAPSKGPETQ